MNNKMTDKQERILAILKEDFEGSAFAEDILTKTQGLTIQSVRATLSSLAPKGLVSKTKEVKNGKILTKYTVINTAE